MRLSTSDIRIVTRLLMLLRRKYSVVFSYQDIDLAPLIAERLEALDDPELDHLWMSLSESFRSQTFEGMTPDSVMRRRKARASRREQNSIEWLNTQQFFSPEQAVKPSSQVTG